MGVRLGYRYQDGLKPTSCLGLSALPPDVRRGLCPAVSHSIDFGLCPWSGFSPATEGRARTRGAARTFAASLTGGAKPTPHIRRQSRSASNSSLWGKAVRAQFLSKKRETHCGCPVRRKEVPTPRSTSCSSLSSAFASFRSAVSNPSVNQL